MHPYDEAASVSAAETKLCDAEVHDCISGADYTSRGSQQDECYGTGDCVRLCVISVCYSVVLLYCYSVMLL